MIFILIVEFISFGIISIIKLVNRNLPYTSKIDIKTKRWDLPHPIFKRQLRPSENLIYDPNHSFYEYRTINSAPYNYDEKKEKNHLRIFFLGGSTMFGVGVNGYKKTIPGIYNNLTNEIKCNKQIYVYNDGNNGFSPKLDFIKLSTKIIPFGKPDLVITLQGYNNYSGYSGYRPLDDIENAPIFSNYWTRREQQIYGLLNSNNIFYSNLKKIFYTKFFLGHLTDGILTKITRMNYLKATYDTKPDFKIATESYFHYINLSKDLSVGNNFKFYNFLQPTLNYKKYPSDFESGMLEVKDGYFFGPYPVSVIKNYWKPFEKFYEYLKSNQQLISKHEDKWFYDISELFTNEKEQLFVDPSHYNQMGNRIIAEEIFKNTKKDLIELCK